MQHTFATEPRPEQTDSPDKAQMTPDFSQPMKPIAEMIDRADFPQCALGKFVDIGGYTGVVVEIVKHSLKVTSEEGTTMSYNANGLRKIYGSKTRVPEQNETSSISQPERSETAVASVALPSHPSAESGGIEAYPADVKAEIPKANIVAEPDFNRPAKPIVDFAGRPDFPQCTLGEFLNIGGYAGAVVEIVKQSLKVRSPEGTTVSYNANGLRKLYAPKTRVEFNDVNEMPMRSAEARMEEAAAPQPIVITKPDFVQPMKAIRVFAGRRDFPECALGQYVDIRGYSGVVVAIKDDTLEVQSPDGLTRSYGAVGLRKLFS